LQRRPVWRRFDRPSKAGVFQDSFAVPAGLGGTAHLVQMHDDSDRTGSHCK